MRSAPHSRPVLPRLAHSSRVCLLCLSFVFVLGASSGQAQQPQQITPPNTPSRTIRIQGTVRTSEGARLGTGVKVRLEGEDGHLIFERPADSDGSFYFEGMQERRYLLVVASSGFETHQEILEFPEGVHVLVSNVALIRLPKDSADAAAAESRSDSMAPKNARKEFEKASKELAAQDLEKAKADLDSAIKLYPCYARAQAHLATVLETRHDPSGAEAALRKAIGCDPDYLSSYIVLGQMLNDQKRFAESVPILEAAERRSPSSWQLCYQLGVAYFGLEQYTKAESEYRKVLEFNPSPPAELPLRLADVYLKAKDYQKAYSEMEQYLKSEPNGRFAEKVRGIMRQTKVSRVANQPQAANQ